MNVFLLRFEEIYFHLNLLFQKFCAKSHHSKLTSFTCMLQGKNFHLHNYEATILETVIGITGLYLLFCLQSSAEISIFSNFIFYLRHVCNVVHMHWRTVCCKFILKNIAIIITETLCLMKVNYFFKQYATGNFSSNVCAGKLLLSNSVLFFSGPCV